MLVRRLLPLLHPARRIRNTVRLSSRYSLVHLKLFIFGPLLVKLPLYLLGFCGS